MARNFSHDPDDQSVNMTFDARANDILADGGDSDGHATGSLTMPNETGRSASPTW
jgi:hypothetical protein